MSLAVCTMVYDDAEFLKIWLRYWTARLPAKSLYVLVHGAREEMMDLVQGATRIPLHRPEPYKNMEEDRWHMLSGLASGLSHMHSTVVYTDVDEILLVDPDVNEDIIQTLIDLPDPVTTPYGIELIHRTDREPNLLDLSGNVLEQRSLVRATNFYCKPCIIKQPVSWGRGGHFSSYENVHFKAGLFNLHLRFMDEGLFMQRATKRRRTTFTNLKINTTDRRRWRTSEDAAKEYLKRHIAYPVANNDDRAPDMSHVVRPIVRRASMKDTNMGKLRTFPFREAEALQVLPPRFRQLV